METKNNMVIPLKTWKLFFLLENIALNLETFLLTWSLLYEFRNQRITITTGIFTTK